MKNPRERLRDARIISVDDGWNISKITQPYTRLFFSRVARLSLILPNKPPFLLWMYHFKRHQNNGPLLLRKFIYFLFSPIEPNPHYLLDKFIAYPDRRPYPKKATQDRLQPGTSIWKQNSIFILISSYYSYLKYALGIIQFCRKMFSYSR